VSDSTGNETLPEYVTLKLYKKDKTDGGKSVSGFRGSNLIVLSGQNFQTNCKMGLKMLTSQVLDVISFFLCFPTYEHLGWKVSGADGTSDLSDHCPYLLLLRSSQL